MEKAADQQDLSPVIISTPHKDDGPTLADTAASGSDGKEAMTVVQLTSDPRDLSPIPLTPTKSSPTLKSHELHHSKVYLQRSASTTSLPDTRNKPSTRHFGLNMSPGLSEEGRVNEVELEIRRRKSEKLCKLISIAAAIIVTVMVSVL